jgi:hypothetical protein
MLRESLAERLRNFVTCFLISWYFAVLLKFSLSYWKNTRWVACDIALMIN